ncbi:MAG: major capsid protein [Paracoccus sp.]|nr:major capsid protein [Paracoccus sp. (in: a-proteobacteria)]
MLTDIFNDDAFRVLEQTLRVNELERFPHVPTYFTNVFEVDNISTTTVQLEKRTTGVQDVSVVARGTVAPVVATTEEDEAIPVNSRKIGNVVRVTTADIQDRRGAGELTLESVQSVSDRRIAEYLRSHAIKREAMLLSAARGVWTLPNNAVAANYFTLYGVTPQDTFELNLAGSGLGKHHLRAKIEAFLGAAEDRAEGIEWTDVDWVCGKGAFSTLTNFTEVREDFARWVNLARPEGTPLAPFRYAGINLVRGRHASLGDDEIVPVFRGIPGMYRSVYTPGDYMDAVNGPGLMRYASAKLLDHSKGIEYELASFPVDACTRPELLQPIVATVAAP